MTETAHQLYLDSAEFNKLCEIFPNYSHHLLGYIFHTNSYDLPASIESLCLKPDESVVPPEYSMLDPTYTPTSSPENDTVAVYDPTQPENDDSAIDLQDLFGLDSTVDHQHDQAPTYNYEALHSDPYYIHHHQQQQQRQHCYPNHHQTTSPNSTYSTQQNVECSNPTMDYLQTSPLPSLGNTLSHTHDGSDTGNALYQQFSQFGDASEQTDCFTTNDNVDSQHSYLSYNQIVSLVEDSIKESESSLSSSNTSSFSYHSVPQQGPEEISQLRDDDVFEINYNNRSDNQQQQYQPQSCFDHGSSLDIPDPIIPTLPDPIIPTIPDPIIPTIPDPIIPPTVVSTIPDPIIPAVPDPIIPAIPDPIIPKQSTLPPSSPRLKHSDLSDVPWPVVPGSPLKPALDIPVPIIPSGPAPVANIEQPQQQMKVDIVSDPQLDNKTILYTALTEAQLDLQRAQAVYYQAQAALFKAQETFHNAYQQYAQSILDQNQHIQTRSTQSSSSSSNDIVHTPHTQSSSSSNDIVHTPHTLPPSPSIHAEIPNKHIYPDLIPIVPKHDPPRVEIDSQLEVLPKADNMAHCVELLSSDDDNDELKLSTSDSDDSDHDFDYEKSQISDEHRIAGFLDQRSIAAAEANDAIALFNEILTTWSESEFNAKEYRAMIESNKINNDQLSDALVELEALHTRIEECKEGLRAWKNEIRRCSENIDEIDAFITSLVPNFVITEEYKIHIPEIPESPPEWQQVKEYITEINHLQSPEIEQHITDPSLLSSPNSSFSTNLAGFCWEPHSIVPKKRSHMSLREFNLLSRKPLTNDWASGEKLKFEPLPRPRQAITPPVPQPIVPKQNIPTAPVVDRHTLDRSSLVQSVLQFLPGKEYLDIRTIINAFKSEARGHGYTIHPESQDVAVLESVFWPLLYGTDLQRPEGALPGLDPLILTLTNAELWDIRHTVQTMINMISAKNDKAHLAHIAKWVDVWISIVSVYENVLKEFAPGQAPSNFTLPADRALFSHGKLDLHGQTARTATVVSHFFITVMLQHQVLARTIFLAGFPPSKVRTAINKLDKLIDYSFCQIPSGRSPPPNCIVYHVLNTYINPHLVASSSAPSTITLIVGSGNHSGAAGLVLDKAVMNVAQQFGVPVAHRGPAVMIMFDHGWEPPGIRLALPYDSFLS